MLLLVRVMLSLRKRYTRCVSHRSLGMRIAHLLLVLSCIVGLGLRVHVHHLIFVVRQAHVLGVTHMMCRIGLTSGIGDWVMGLGSWMMRMRVPSYRRRRQLVARGTNILWVGC